MNSNITLQNSNTNVISNSWKLLICIIICQAVGLSAGYLTNTQNNVWYDNIVKPSWNPPGYLFGPVWTILYLLMGISLWIIWKSNAPEHKKLNAELVFAAQLFLNFWWTIIFFKFQAPELAFAEILLMIILILITIFKFAEISRTAAWLLVPYISWVCFAAILNYNLWILNK